MEHLWAPWRMEYVERNKPEKETCVFCEAFSNPSLDRKIWFCLEGNTLLLF